MIIDINHILKTIFTEKTHLLIKAEYSPTERMRVTLPNFLKRNCILTLSGIVGNPVISGVMKYKC